MIKEREFVVVFILVFGATCVGCCLSCLGGGLWSDQNNNIIIMEVQLSPKTKFTSGILTRIAHEPESYQIKSNQIKSNQAESDLNFG